MHFDALTIIFLVTCSDGLPDDSNVGHWGQWSDCSTTCGEGHRTRQRKCMSSDTACIDVRTETKNCFLQYCPSYLSWPRIHFSGEMLADTATINNFRCAYDNNKFSAFMQTKHYVRLEEKSNTHVSYKAKYGNWNPDGTNQFYFVDTFVTSFCRSPNNCSLTESIVGSTVTENIRGVMACVGPDWQIDEIWALQVHIPGVMDGNLLPTTRRSLARRYDDPSSLSLNQTMSRFKSKLVNVTWHDDYYRNAFLDARELSMTFVYDLYNLRTLTGRISGTIGLTSPDDARQVTTTRVLQSVGKSFSKMLGSAPFFVHYSQKTLTIDLANSLKGRKNGIIPDPNSGNLDLALLLSKKGHCRNFVSKRSCLDKRGGNKFTFRRITSGGKIPGRIEHGSSWYTKYGGVLDIDLSHLDDTTMKLIKHTRIALIDRNNSTYFEEFPHGINIGLMEFSSLRLDTGDTGAFHGFVSLFGRPVKNAQFNLNIVKHEVSDGRCDYSDCNRSLGIPTEVIAIPANDHPLLTNRTGMVRLDVKAVGDPGNPRGCGLDGQIYPLQLIVRYSKGGKSFTYSDHDVTLNNVAKPTDFVTNEEPVVVKIYSYVQEKTCPTWRDVKDIFISYYNMYPAMWKTGTIDLHSYLNIFLRAKIMKVAMFDLDIKDPRYMPVTRDLSKHKRKLIYNWMKCGMKKDDSEPSSKKNIIYTEDEIENGMEEVRNLLHKAMMLELSTIPPYVTAWLSLKTEFGRNAQIADLLKSIFCEEMLHMTLDANILNAVGGTANMTDMTRLPAYPMILASGESYQILPDVKIGIAPFSIGLLQDVFSNIEKPSSQLAKEATYNLAKIWKILPFRTGDNLTSSNMKKLLREHAERNETELKQLNVIQKLSWSYENRTSDLQHNLESWRDLAIFSNDNLKSLSSSAAKTVGEFYLLLAFKLTFLESCLQVRNLELLLNDNVTHEHRKKTIFSGNISYQLNISHWYELSATAVLSVVESMGGDMTSPHIIQLEKTKKSLSVRPPLFEVTDLKTALEAIVEIIYQGESGSQCSPFVPETDVYASDKGRDAGSELSHYYIFQEIVNGRKLVKSTRPRENLNCLNISQPDLCPDLAKYGEQYCYAGDQITFYEDGVWPILSNPQEHDYRSGTKAYLLHRQFNILYTRMLFCIEKAFCGDPSRIGHCMATMYDLTIAGKKLVQTPLDVSGDTTARNGAPTWLFVRELPYRAGLPLYDST